MSVPLFNKLRDGAWEFIADEEAQGITEYGAMLSFVAIIIALAFGFYNGSLSNAVSKAFSVIVSQLDNMSTFAGGSS